MKFEEIEAVFKSGDKKAIEEVSDKILSLNDVAMLKKLSCHFDEFRILVSNLPVENEHFQDYRHSSLMASNLLGELARGNCLCALYKTACSVPGFEENQGRIKIPSKITDRELHETT